ncbi:YciI family protein [Chengkuizengella axinellae]|uniref:YciI family protein n=1 Tax=Chengkuizengella axinellae TaxID=3064388 RepID=A0ABT9IU66_9BACL|nr:YciI family protein [Chengkuizengella sp. 2205SS18-9]MDP5272904.1 YciI family protein [Chengkuizengella sp. 2205SS18-9]
MAENTTQFIYVLKLIPRLLDETKWTDIENDIVGRHFKALQQLQKEGQLILAGRTQNMDETTFGIVIFKAENKKEANHIMENDPAVKEGIMTANLYPYQVALISEANI